MKKFLPFLLISVVVFGVGCEPAGPSDADLARMTPDQIKFAIQQEMELRPPKEVPVQEREKMSNEMREMVLSGVVERTAVLQRQTHDTKGEARIIKRDGRHYLALSEDFEVDAGPYLVVLLSAHPDARDSKEVHVGEVLELGKLMKTSGGQMYEIPKGTDLSLFRTVVIYCKPYKVVFGSGRFQ